MIVTQSQNIFDVCLQGYGSLDFLVKMASENDLSIDEAPPRGIEILLDSNLGEKRVKQFVNENNWIYNNNVIEANAVIIANNDFDVLSPATEVIFIYK